MANTVPATFSFTIVDELGTKATQLEYALVDPAITVTQLEGQYNTIGLALDNIIDGQILGGKIAIEQGVPSGAKTAVTAGARVEQTAVLNFSATGTPLKFGEAVPSISSSKIVGGKLDLTDTDVMTFFGLLVTSGLSVLDWTSNNRQNLAALLDAILSFRKRRKQLSRSSFEQET